MKRLRLALLSILFVSPAIAQDEVVFPEGSSFGLIPFEGSEPAEDFAGFVDPQTLNSVLIMELPKPPTGDIFEQIRDPAALASQGVTAERIDEIEIDGMPTLRIAGTQTAQGLSDIPKCILVLKAEDAIGLITAQMPAESEGDACALLRGVTKRDGPTLEDKIAALPFSLGDLGPMQVENTLAGSGVLLTPMEKGQDRAMMVIAHSLGVSQPESTAEQRMAMSENALRGIDGLTDFAVDGRREIEIDGAPATELTASATENGTDGRQRIVQWVRFAPEGTLRLIGQSEEDRFDEYRPVFEAIRDGITVK